MQWQRTQGTVAEVAAKVKPYDVRQMVELVSCLHGMIEEGGQVIHLSALYGDDDVWTVRQQIQSLYNNTEAARD